MVNNIGISSVRENKIAFGHDVPNNSRKLIVDILFEK